jgi:hypothetical protein
MCQVPFPSDSLGKYSYEIFTIRYKDAAAHFGTAFFITRNGSLYAITAHHTFVSCDSLTKKEFYPFDQAFISLSTTMPPIPLVIIKPRDTCSCLTVDKNPDLLVFELDKKYIPFVNSVDSFMLPPFIGYADAEIYGQGFTRDSATLQLTSPHHIHLPSKTFEIGQFYGDINTKIIDSINYYFFVTTLKFNSKFKGYSGAPVFLQDSASKKWRVAGVITGGMQFGIDNQVKETIIVTKQDFITDVLNSGHFGLQRPECR